MFESGEMTYSWVTEAPELPPSRALRRRWIIIVPVAVVLVATGVAGGLVVVYQPLVSGGLGGTPSPSITFRDLDDPAGRFNTRVVTYAQNAELHILFSLRNDGPWGVTVTAIPGRDFGLFHVTEVRRGVLNRCCAEFEPFAPFSLAPGEERAIRLVGVMKGCRDHASGSTSAWSSYDVRYRVLGMTRLRSVEMREAIAIEVPDKYRCTER